VLKGNKVSTRAPLSGEKRHLISKGKNFSSLKVALFTDAGKIGKTGRIIKERIIKV